MRHRVIDDACPYSNRRRRRTSCRRRASELLICTEIWTRVAQKANVTTGGGYLDASFTLGPQVAAAITYVDDSLGRVVDELKQRNLYSSTVIIVTAKHGRACVKTY